MNRNAGSTVDSSSFHVAALVALLVLPAAAVGESADPPARAPSESSPEVPGVTQPPAARPLAGFGLAGFAGYELGNDFSGPSLRLDAELPLLKDPSRTRLSLLASIGYSRRTGTWPTVEYWVVADAPVTLSTLTVVPALRAARRLSRRFTLLSELGIGVFWATREETWNGNRETSRYRELIARLGAGCSFQVNDRLSVGPMLELSRYYGHSHEQEQLTYLAQAGALFQL